MKGNLFFNLLGELHDGGEPAEGDGGTRGSAEELPTASLERTPLGPTRGNLMGESLLWELSGASEFPEQ